MSVHLRHFNIRNDQIHLVIEILIIAHSTEVIPCLLAIIEILHIHKACTFQRIVNHFLQKYRILCDYKRTVAQWTIPHLLHFRDLNRRFRRNLSHDLLKVQNCYQFSRTLRDTGCHAFFPMRQCLIRFLDIFPGDTADSLNALHAECHGHLVEICHDEKIPWFMPQIFTGQIVAQIDDCDQDIPWLEDSLHCRVRMRHHLHLFTHHDLFDLCHVDSIEFSLDRELHDLDLIGA